MTLSAFCEKRYPVIVTFFFQSYPCNWMVYYRSPWFSIIVHSTQTDKNIFLWTNFTLEFRFSFLLRWALTIFQEIFLWRIKSWTFFVLSMGKTCYEYKKNVPLGIYRFYCGILNLYTHVKLHIFQRRYCDRFFLLHRSLTLLCAIIKSLLRTCFSVQTVERAIFIEKCPRYCRKLQQP